MLNSYFGYMAKMGTDIAPAVQKVSNSARNTRSDSSDVQRAREGDREARPSSAGQSLAAHEYELAGHSSRAQELVSAPRVDERESARDERLDLVC